MSGSELTEVVKYLEERAKRIAKYSDKLSDAIDKIDRFLEEVGETAGVKFIDTEVFYEHKLPDYGETEEFRLAVAKRRLGWGLMVERKLGTYSGLEYLIRKSRDVKKAAVKRLPAFLKAYAEALEQTEKEVKEFSEKAERIAQILEGDK